MGKRYKIVIFIWGWLLALGLAPLTGRAQESLPLDEAVTARQLAVVIRGRSSSFIQPMVVLEAQNLTEQPLWVEIPPGSILESEQNNFCDLALLNILNTTSASIHIDLSQQPVSYRLYAYCLEPLDFPTGEALYHPTDRFVSDEVMAVLENIAQETGARERFAAQLAVWVAATGKNLDQLQQELGADYSLQASQVDKYLAAPEHLPTPDPQAANHETPEVAQGNASDALGQTAQPENSGADLNYFVLAVAGLILVAVGLLALAVFQRPKLSAPLPGPAQPSTPSQKRPAGAEELPLNRNCVVCQQPFDARGKCVNPNCSTNKRGGRVGIGLRPENTQPIPVEEPPAGWLEEVSRPPLKAQTGNVIEPIQIQSDDKSFPEAYGDEANRPPREAAPFHEQTAPLAVNHEETEPLGVIDTPPAGQFGPDEDTPLQDRLTLKVLRGDQQGAEFILPGLQGVISRGRAGQIVIQGDSKVSAPHATLAIYHWNPDSQDKIRDLGSKNGTLKNGHPLDQTWSDLNDGDLLQFGLTKMRYDQDKRQLVYEDGRHPPKSLLGNNRWLITRRELPFIDFESNDVAISVPHVYIKANGHLEVRDLSSGNGIYVQGRKIERRELIFNEDVIQFGRETELQVITTIDNIPKEIDGVWQQKGWLGGGGMADVYRIRHKRSGEIQALKIPRPSKYRRNDREGARYRELFERESELAQQIDHPNLVKVYEFGELPGSGLPYLRMEYIDGPSVEAILEKLKHISAVDVAEIAIQVGQALQFLHTQHNYVHGDVKPNNIIVDYRGQVYLTDLGVAAQVGQKFSGLGVFKYLPNEVLDGAAVGADTDIYALGQTMFEMLTRQPPAGAQDRSGAIAVQTDQITTSGYELPGTALSRLARAAETEALALIIKTCTGPRKNRYQYMAQLLEALEPLRKGADLKTLAAKTGWKPST